MLRTLCRFTKQVGFQPKLHKFSFATSQGSEKRGSFMQTIREAIMKPMEENPQDQALKQEIDYYDLAKKVQNLSMENKEIAQQLMEIHQGILKVQEESYHDKDVEILLSSVSTRDLCEFAAQQYVGSMSIPRNENIMKMFLEYAVKNAKTKEEHLEVEFFMLYLRKLTAIQQGNQADYEHSNEELIRLANEEDHPIAMHIIGKEVYKVGLNILNSKYKKNKQEYFNQALDLFVRAAEKGSFQSFYYMAEMAENGDFPGGVDLKLAYEYYTIAAAHGSAQAFFNLARFYRDGIIEKKNTELEHFYTKQAAEMGMTEAQHNLACMYLEGKIVEYDSLKAIAWFSYAGAAGFAHSQYNAARLYKEGGKDGKVKKNLSAAMTWLDRIHKEGKIDVSNLVFEVNAELEQQEHQQLEVLKNQTEMRL